MTEDWLTERQLFMWAMYGAQHLSSPSHVSNINFFHMKRNVNTEGKSSLFTMVHVKISSFQRRTMHYNTEL